jgi:hypothetical protein
MRRRRDATRRRGWHRAAWKLGRSHEPPLLCSGCLGWQRLWGLRYRSGAQKRITVGASVLPGSTPRRWKMRRRTRQPGLGRQRIPPHLGGARIAVRSTASPTGWTAVRSVAALGLHGLTIWSGLPLVPMPIPTTQDEVGTWMEAPAPVALQLQRPLPGDALRVVARGEKQDGASSAPAISLLL